jgi:hypothetical protein
MGSLWKNLAEKVKAFATNWAIYSAVGTFTLYLAGYLSLRFHLTLFGVGTDLSVLEERYFFAGARFFVYLCFTVPTVLLLAFVPGAICCLIYRLLPVGVRAGIRSFFFRRNTMALIGIVVSVAMIQFVMRQCFFLSNVLLAHELPGPEWLRCLLVTRNEAARALYFAGLVAACAITGALLAGASIQEKQNAVSRFFARLLAFLFAIELLLLPINHGILIADKVIAKVADFGGKEPLASGQEAWLVWEGVDGVTFFVRGTGDTRTLLTVNKKDVEKIKIIGYEPILRTLFAP